MEESVDALQCIDLVDEELLYSASTLRNPPNGVRAIFSALLLLTSPRERLREDVSWQAALQIFFKRSRSEVDNAVEAQERYQSLTESEKQQYVSFQKTVCQGFLESLRSFDRKGLARANVEALRPYLEDPNFSIESLKRAAGNLAYLAQFVRLMCDYPRPKHERKGVRLQTENGTQNASAKHDKPFSTLQQPDKEMALALIKPDAVRMGYGDAIVKLINLKGFTVIEKVEARLTKDQAAALYAEHSRKPFFSKLTDFMSSGPVIALVIEKADCVNAWRRTMGPTDAVRAKLEAPESLRALFGTDNMRNAVHGSRSLAASQSQILFFFPYLVLDAMPDTSLENWQYLGQTVGVRLTNAMSQIVRAKPADPYAWLAIYFAGKLPHDDKQKASTDYPEAVMGDFWGVMKSDQFAGIHKLPGPMRPVPGVPNFRRGVKTNRVYGLGQPTVDGIRAVLKETAKDGFKTALWINLREEPVVYINGHPFSPRDPNHLNNNVDYLLGIEGSELEAMERRLKSDLVGLTARQDNRFDFYHQLLDGSNEGREDRVRADSIRTPREVFDDLAHENCMVQYARLPIQDLVGPERKDYDELVHYINTVRDDAAIIFNCQTGMGRTNTAMVSTQLVLKAKADCDSSRKKPPPRMSLLMGRSSDGHVQQDADLPALTYDLPAKMKLQYSRSDPTPLSGALPPESGGTMVPANTGLQSPRDGGHVHPTVLTQSYNVNLTLTSADHDGSDIHSADASNKGALVVSEPAQSDEPVDPQDAPDSYTRLKAGYFAAVSALVNVSRNGRAVKAEVDDAIDCNATLTHLREAIVECKVLSETSDRSRLNNHPPSYWLRRGLNFLERYWYLIAFNSYIREEASNKFETTFSSWLNERWLLTKPLRGLSLE